MIKFGGTTLKRTMKHLALPPMAMRRLPFYLAMEEWAALTLPPDDYFFAWRVAPTVICGRHQDIEREVDLAYCSREGIDVVRRKSGGGAVYADMDNFMFSYITPGDEMSSVFSRYTSMIASMLASLGIEAKPTGRNDIFIGTSKVAGNAFYHLPGRCIAHGTMLYDFDPGRLMRAITPSRAKLESKSVTSAPARLTTLKASGIKIGIEDFGRYAVHYLCGDDCILVTDEDIKQIEQIEKSYYDPAFISGRVNRLSSKSVDITRKNRIEGVGEFEVAINLAQDNTISGLGIWGDFFVGGDINSEIIEPLTGVAYEREILKQKIDAINTQSVINGLTPSILLNLLI